MRNLFLVSLLFVFAACNNATETKDEPVKDSVAADARPVAEPGYIHKFGDTALENKITAALLKLSFVQKSNRYIDSISGHKQGISFMLDSTGNSNEISVQAGYNGDQRFETYYHFYVNAKNLDIKVYDPVADKRLTVKEYLKTLK